MSAFAVVLVILGDHNYILPTYAKFDYMPMKLSCNVKSHLVEQGRCVVVKALEYILDEKLPYSKRAVAILILLAIVRKCAHFTVVE